MPEYTDGVAATTDDSRLSTRYTVVLLGPHDAASSWSKWENAVMVSARAARRSEYLRGKAPAGGTPGLWLSAFDGAYKSAKFV